MAEKVQMPKVSARKFSFGISKILVMLKNNPKKFNNKTFHIASS